MVLKHGKYPCDYLADEWTSLLVKFHDKYREVMPAGHFDACVWPFLLWKEKHTTIYYMEQILELDVTDISPSSIRTCIEKANTYHLGLPLKLQLPYNGVYEFVIGTRFTYREFTVHVLECLWCDVYPPCFVELLDLRFSGTVEAADLMKVTTQIQKRMVCWATRISNLGFDGSGAVEKRHKFRSSSYSASWTLRRLILISKLRFSNAKWFHLAITRLNTSESGKFIFGGAGVLKLPLGKKKFISMKSLFLRVLFRVLSRTIPDAYFKQNALEHRHGCDVSMFLCLFGKFIVGSVFTEYTTAHIRDHVSDVDNMCGSASSLPPSADPRWDDPL